MQRILIASALLFASAAWAETPATSDTGCRQAAASIASDVYQAQLGQPLGSRSARDCRLSVTVNSTGAVDALRFEDCDAAGRAHALRVLAQAQPLPPPAACERPEFTLTLPADLGRSRR